MEVYQQQIEMEKLNHQGELMLKKATDETDRDIIKEPLTELKHLWENLGEKIAHRQVEIRPGLCLVWAESLGCSLPSCPTSTLLFHLSPCPA